MDDPQTIVRLSSRRIAQSQRAAAVSEIHGRGPLNIKIEPQTDDPQLDVELRTLPGLFITTGSSTPNRATSHDLSLEDDDFLFVWGERGGQMLQPGQSVASNEGTTLLACCEMVMAEANHTMRHRTLRIDRRMLMSVLPDAEDAVAKAVPMSGEALRLLDSYISMIGANGEPSSPALAQAAATHICDLVALAVGTTADAERKAARRGRSGARLSSIRAWIRARLNDPQLSVRDAATAHRVSPRYMQMLFEREGTSFSAFVRSERLALARRQLTAPGAAARSIASIALDAGFNDISYFNRAFRRAYGETPTDARQRAIAPATA